MKVKFGKFQNMGRQFHDGRKAKVFFEGEHVGFVVTEYERDHTYSPWVVSSYEFTQNGVPGHILILVTHTAAHATLKLKSQIAHQVISSRKS